MGGGGGGMGREGEVERGWEPGEVGISYTNPITCANFALKCYRICIKLIVRFLNYSHWNIFSSLH